MRLAFAAAALLALLAQGPAAAATVCPRKGKIAAAGKCSTKYHVCARKGARPTRVLTCVRGKFFNAASSSCEVRPACKPQQPGGVGGTMLGGSAYDNGYQNGTYTYPLPGQTYCCYNKKQYDNARRYTLEKTCTVPTWSEAGYDDDWKSWEVKVTTTLDKDKKEVMTFYGNRWVWPKMKKCCDPGWFTSDRVIAPCNDGPNPFEN